MNQIASFFATLGYRIDNSGLNKFERSLKSLKTQVDSQGGVSGALDNTRKKSSKLFTDIKSNYTKVRPTLEQMWRDLDRVKESTELSEDERRQSRARILKGINEQHKKNFKTQAANNRKLEQQQEKFAREFNRRQRERQRERQKYVDQSVKAQQQAENKRQNALERTRRKLLQIEKRYNAQSGKLKQIRKDVADVNKSHRRGLITDKERSDTVSKLYQQYRDIQNQEVSAGKTSEQLSKERQNALERTRRKLIQIEKRYNKHSAKLKEVRNDVSFVNQEYRKGNITLDQRKERVEQLVREYRRLQAAQAATAQTRTGAAGGIYADGSDPRQVGNHRIISAIHSDIGLGAIVGGFAAAQSSRAYQEFQAMQQGLTAATGSMEQAGEEMEFLTGLSRKLGLFVGDLGQSFSSFAAAARGSSLSAQEVRDTFEGVASQARVLNLSAADTEGVMRSLVQMMNKGQIMAEELDFRLAA